MTATVPMTCTFKFRHPKKDRETCGLPVIVERPGHEPRCPWHDREARPEGFNVKRELEEVLRSPNHWLEGADLAEEDLRQLNGNGAQLPSADLAGADLDDAQFHKAILDDASLISASMPRAQLSYASLIDTEMTKTHLEGANLTYSNLSGAHLHGTTLDRASLYGIKLSADTLFLGVVWGKSGEMLLQQFDKAASLFRTLRTHFRALSNLREAEHFYYWEMTALHLRAINAEYVPDRNLEWQVCDSIWRRQNTHMMNAPRRRFGMFFTWLGWAVNRWVWGYGVKPLRTVICMVIVILLFGLVVFPVVGVQEDKIVTHDPRSGLALSVVTFATLGYGNRTPCGTFGEFLGGVEAMLGVLLMSVFVVALATRHVHVN